MACYSFTEKILAGDTIKIFNNGDMYRDFTYVDDIVRGISNMLYVPPIPDQSGVRSKVYNIGNNKPVKLTRFIEQLELSLEEVYNRAFNVKKEYLPMQAGDVYQTYADVDDLIADFNFKPETSIADGLLSFAKWYKDYHI
jgi:UDP-glucuronate 4-epimerase